MGSEHLPLKREEKLKAFSVVCLPKDLPEEVEKDLRERLLLFTASSYNVAEMITIVRDAFVENGIDPDDYHIPFILNGSAIEDFAGVSPKRGDIVRYIRFVFDEFGTKKEKEISENVIKKFEEYVKDRK